MNVRVPTQPNVSPTHGAPGPSVVYPSAGLAAREALLREDRRPMRHHDEFIRQRGTLPRLQVAMPGGSVPSRAEAAPGILSRGTRPRLGPEIGCAPRWTRACPNGMAWLQAVREAGEAAGLRQPPRLQRA